MHITQLRLQGFKSFVEPVDLQIRPGLTGVVGPNGCGKSNLLEALRWVMGETSFKAMRGGAMEDVIFAGTQTRPPRNSAAVSVFVDNSARTAPAEFNDDDLLEITRLIRRGEGSSYQVNGRAVRAKDVKLLFEDAATGARSHALVRQGQIGEIVNSKPEARRRILEDAAGIAGLHSRRHEAELRLNAAEGNLERLADVMGQVEAQLTSLKRQARHAQRYKELSQTLRGLEAMQLYLKWRNAGQQVTRAEEELQAILKRFAAQTLEETNALTTREELTAAIQPLRDEEVRAAAIVQRLGLAEKSLAQEEQQKRQRQAELNTALGEARADLSRDKSLIEEGAVMSSRLEEEQSSLKAAQTSLEERSSGADQKLDELKAVLSSSEASLSDVSGQMVSARANHQSLKADVERLNSRASRFNEVRTELEAEKETLLAEIDEGGQDDYGEEIDRLEQEVAQLEDLIEDDNNRIDIQRRDLEQSQQEKAALALDLSALSTEISMIEKLIAPHRTESQRPLFEAIEAEPGYETALTALLGETLEVPLLSLSDVTDKIGSYWLDETVALASLPDLPAGVTALVAYVKGPANLKSRFLMTGVVDETMGAKLQAQLQPGQCLVSKAGDLWRWDGYCTSADDDSRAVLRLRERNRLPDLSAEKETLEAKVQLLQEQIDQLNDALETQKLLLVEHKQMLGEKQQKLRTLVAEQKAADAASQETRQRLAAIETSLMNATEEIQQAANRAVEVNLELAALPRLDVLTKKHTSLEAQVHEQRSAYSAAHIEAAQLKGQAEVNEKRLKALAEEQALWSRRAMEARGHITALETRIEKITAELELFNDYPDEMAARRHALFEEKKKAEEGRRHAADQLSEAETLLQDHDKFLKDLQAALIASREEKARIETRLEGARANFMQLASSIETDLNVKPEQCLAIAGIGIEDDLPRLMDVEADLTRVRRDRDRLGAVNLRAEEEIRTLEEQFGSMVTERDDLTDAVSQLRNAVQQLNEEGRQRLLKAFDAVNVHFKRLFQTLFAGGEAELKLVDSDDPLHAGLEIIARPPGKKPQVLTLLSGGEKALTAMSLIFAVFLTNPSPICVLDEVDAPLDDSNVDRFCLMMEEMARSTDTRFLVITHHPMTMERMDRLYGVTMSEKGVSQLVSVDLETAASLRETA